MFLVNLSLLFSTINAFFYLQLLVFHCSDADINVGKISKFYSCIIQIHLSFCTKYTLPLCRIDAVVVQSI